jgi:hypothetical protein
MRSVSDTGLQVLPLRKVNTALAVVGLLAAGPLASAAIRATVAQWTDRAGSLSATALAIELPQATNAGRQADRENREPVVGAMANQERAAPNRAPRGLFAGLRVGQMVTVKEAGGRFELTFFDDLPVGPVGQKIAEIGADYVVIDDGVGVSETRIPVYSIKSIVRHKAFRR